MYTDIKNMLTASRPKQVCTSNDVGGDQPQAPSGVAALAAAFAATAGAGVVLA